MQKGEVGWGVFAPMVDCLRSIGLLAKATLLNAVANSEAGHKRSVAFTRGSVIVNPIAHSSYCITSASLKLLVYTHGKTSRHRHYHSAHWCYYFWLWLSLPSDCCFNPLMRAASAYISFTSWRIRFSRAYKIRQISIWYTYALVTGSIIINSSLTCFFMRAAWVSTFLRLSFSLLISWRISILLFARVPRWPAPAMKVEISD